MSEVMHIDHPLRFVLQVTQCRSRQMFFKICKPFLRDMQTLKLKNVQQCKSSKEKNSHSLVLQLQMYVIEIQRA